MIKFIEKNITEILFAFIVFLIIAIGVTFEIVDRSELTHFTQIGTVLDKWRENSCSTTYDGTSYYTDCDYIYTLVVDLQGNNLEEKVSNQYFKQFKIGESIDYQYDLGKLGGIHNETLSHAN
jgi:hypothetical protein